MENIPHILRHGITHFTSANSNPTFLSIGDNSLISSRNSYVLNNGKNLGEYIPFYFGVRMPMLYVIQHGFNMVLPTPPENIVYCVSSVQKIIDLQLDFLFTDGHAVDSFTTQYTRSDIASIDTLLDKRAINAKYWKDDNDLDMKRRKEAEFLVLGDISYSSILGFITYNESARDKLVNLGANRSVVFVKSEYYF